MYDPDQPPEGDAGLFGLPNTPADAALVIVPVPWDATTSYRAGTSRGPEAIRLASHQLDLYDLELGEPWRAGIAMLPIPADIAAANATARADAERVIAVGGRVAGDPELEAALRRVNAASIVLDRRVETEVSRQLDAGKLVGVLGGDHSVPFGAIAAHARRGKLAVLHIDAHADLRNAYEGFARSHASIMFNVVAELPAVTRLVQVGIRDFCKAEADLVAASDGRIASFYDARLAARKLEGETWRAICDDIVAALPAGDVYISFDIDGLDPRLCPSTGTPVPGGLSFHEATYLIARVVRAGRRLIGFDLNEVAPGADGDEWDANVGARVLYQLCAWTLAANK